MQDEISKEEYANWLEGEVQRQALEVVVEYKAEE